MAEAGAAEEADRLPSADLLEAIRMSCLVEVRLPFQGLGPNAAKELARALEGNSTVTKLCLDGNRLGDQGVMSLAPALTGSAVKELSLVDNEIGVAGATALASALRAMKVLVLGSNNLRDEGAKALAAALPGSCLVELWLFNTLIRDEGAAALAAVLARTEVRRLLLMSNDIGEMGAQALLAAAQRSAITELDLDNAGCSLETLRHIEAVLESNKSRSFDLPALLPIGTSCLQLPFAADTRSIQYVRPRSLHELVGPETIEERELVISWPISGGEQ